MVPFGLRRVNGPAASRRRDLPSRSLDFFGTCYLGPARRLGPFRYLVPWSSETLFFGIPLCGPPYSRTIPSLRRMRCEGCSVRLRVRATCVPLVRSALRCRPLFVRRFGVLWRSLLLSAAGLGLVASLCRTSHSGSLFVLALGLVALFRLCCLLVP